MSDSQDRYYKSIPRMLADILEHTRNTPGHIEHIFHPRDYTGFRCSKTGKRWLMQIIRAREDRVRASALFHINTRDGAAEYLSRGEMPPSIREMASKRFEHDDQGSHQLWTRRPLASEQEALLKPILDAGYELLGRGGHRAVFQADDPEWVFKVALSSRGRTANELESIRSLRYGKESRIPFADCHLSTVLGTEVLMMEWVKPYDIMDPPCRLGDLPEWVQWVDFVQVGWTNQGVLVAYDFERLAEEAGYPS
jgi:hypothetical protein